jgi:phosphoglycerol transferase MdoB-like AlkP superfamily enzyme
MKKTALFLINIGFLLTSLLAYRLVFFFTYADPVGLKMKDIVLAFFIGLRFDLSTAAYVMVPVSVFMFIPYVSLKERYLKALSLFNFFLLALVTIYLFVDLLYYPFSLRHLSFELFNTKGDIMPVVKIGFAEYGFQVLCLVLFITALGAAYYAVIRRVVGRTSPDGYSLTRKVILDAVSFVVVLTLSIILARGGLQMKPLKYSDAFALNSPFLGQLALNGLYTTMRTYYSMKENREMKGWEKRACSREEALQKGREMIVDAQRENIHEPNYPLYRSFTYDPGEFRRLNVVIFIMESWSSRYVGASGGEEDATPFFSRLSKEGVSFRNFFANAQRSIEAISAIITSIPPSGGMVLSQSGALSQMPVRFLPSLLGEKGYRSFFIHGAKRGSMGFSALVRQTGIEQYISKEDILKEGGRDDGVWGIYDEDTFLYGHRLFEAQTTPFFAVIFSLSSHTPYKLPEERFHFYTPEKPFYDFLNSLRYSDYALSRFFDAARNAPYFPNTVFIIVGDHTEGKSAGSSLSQRYSVPCLIYAPHYVDPMRITKTVTHVDLAPTLLDILRSSDNHASFGQSAFIRSPGTGLLPYGDFDIFVREGMMLVSSAQGVVETLPYLGESLGQEKLSRLKKEEGCYTQFFRDLILSNRLYPMGGKPRH